jgi:hypothetical protein
MNSADITLYLIWLKDLVVTVAAAVGAAIAIHGLRTWNRQLKGSAEYELTRRLLKCTYRLRDAIRGVRNPFMSAAEMPAPSAEERAKMSLDQALHYGSVRGYQTRWDPVVAARSDLEAELLEAEVLWSKEVHAKFKPLFSLQHELAHQLRTHLRATDPSVPEHIRSALQAPLDKEREALYEMPGTENSFSIDLSAAVANIEAYLKPRLHK